MRSWRRSGHPRGWLCRKITPTRLSLWRLFSERQKGVPMTRWAFWAALAVGGLMAIQRLPVEKVLVPILTIYLIIAGFLVMLFQKNAWDFLRPLLVVAVALLFLPPLLRDLARGLKQTLLEMNDSLRLGWIFWP